MFKEVETKLREGSDQMAFIDRLIRVSEENPDFTIDDVKGESNTIMMAVCRLV